jgi:hypothetical protein
MIQPPRRPWKVHPIWRGIGCLTAIIGPVIAYVGARLLVNLNQEMGWVAMPYELMRPVQILDLGQPVDHLYADLLVAGILLLLGFALIISIYGVLYSILGPPRYGPLDADPHKDLPPRQRRR